MVMNMVAMAKVSEKLLKVKSLLKRSTSESFHGSINRLNCEMKENQNLIFNRLVEDLNCFMEKDINANVGYLDCNLGNPVSWH